ncbi:hypothetical protein [Streptomyces sp. NPDC058045]|uniref:hypothetical protein n=1 Tax=Streptomyces sp. NPDC058045 TaxID=3346311 RepID=UPI0036EB0886
MTDWPPLLDRIAREPDPELWNDLWSALCHQGSVYPASFTALPWLAETAGGDDREQSVNALVLAGAIMAGAEQPHGAGDVRAQYTAEIESLLTAVNQQLRTASDRTDYLHLLAAVPAFEGAADWSEVLARGLGDREYELDCPGCRTALFIALGEQGFFSTTEDYARSDADVTTSPLLPAAPADLHIIPRRLHATALSDGHPELAHTLTHLLGHTTCPNCETHFSLAELITTTQPPPAPPWRARWSASAGYGVSLFSSWILP